MNSVHFHRMVRLKSINTWRCYLGFIGRKNRQVRPRVTETEMFWHGRIWKLIWRWGQNLVTGDAGLLFGANESLETASNRGIVNAGWNGLNQKQSFQIPAREKERNLNGRFSEGLWGLWKSALAEEKRCYWCSVLEVALKRQIRKVMFLGPVSAERCSKWTAGSCCCNRQQWKVRAKGRWKPAGSQSKP